MHWHSETESSRASPALLNQTYSAGARLARDRLSCGPCIVSPVLKPSGAKKNFKSPRVSGTKSAALSGCRIMALLQLPKLITRVRFPSPAPLISRLSAAPVRIVNELRAKLGDIQSLRQAADQILHAISCCPAEKRSGRFKVHQNQTLEHTLCRAGMDISTSQNHC